MAFTIEQIRDVLSNVLFHMPYAAWVTGVAIGEEFGDAPSQPAILVFVQPVADCELQPVRDLLEAAQAQLGAFQSLLLPTGMFEGLQAKTGDSMSLRAPSQFNLPLVSVGTFGGVINAGGARYALTSNHVIAHNGRAPLGTAIVSPGTLDAAAGGVAGLLSNFVRLTPMAWPAPNLTAIPPNPITAVPVVTKNPADCALARIVPGAGIQAGTRVDLFTGAPIGNIVEKTGRTTGTTTGRINIRACDACVDMAFGTYILGGMAGVLSQAAFAAPGDSGSLAILHAAPQSGVGLVTARGYSTGAGGRFAGYVVLICPLLAVRDGLARDMSVAASNLTLFRD